MSHRLEVKSVLDWLIAHRNFLISFYFQIRARCSTNFKVIFFRCSTQYLSVRIAIHTFPIPLQRISENPQDHNNWWVSMLWLIDWLGWQLVGEHALIDWLTGLTTGGWACFDWLIDWADNGWVSMLWLVDWLGWQRVGEHALIGWLTWLRIGFWNFLPQGKSFLSHFCTESYDASSIVSE